MKHKRAEKVTRFENQNAKIKVSQGAKASINQGGNAFAINAVDIGVVRIRAGQQGQHGQ
jgi:hypothetical protein